MHVRRADGILLLLWEGLQVFWVLGCTCQQGLLLPLYLKNFLMVHHLKKLLILLRPRLLKDWLLKRTMVWLSYQKGWQRDSILMILHFSKRLAEMNMVI